MLRNIEAERVRNGLSREQVAEKMGVSLKTYYNWTREDTDIPGSALLKLAAMFNVEVGYLLNGSKYETKPEREVV